MAALVEACKDPEYPAEIVLVISSAAGVAGLDFAREEVIKTAVTSYDAQTKEAAERQIDKLLQENNIEIVCLAGFMKIVSADLVNKWRGKMINIHPSLLPRHKGLRAQRQALEAGDKQVGCTVHFVTPEMDDGPIIAQGIMDMPVLASDVLVLQEYELSEHILVLEHDCYSAALARVASEDVKIDSNFDIQIISM